MIGNRPQKIVTRQAGGLWGSEEPEARAETVSKDDEQVEQGLTLAEREKKETLEAVQEDKEVRPEVVQEKTQEAKMDAVPKVGKQEGETLPVQEDNDGKEVKEAEAQKEGYTKATEEQEAVVKQADIPKATKEDEARSQYVSPTKKDGTHEHEPHGNEQRATGKSVASVDGNRTDRHNDAEDKERVGMAALL